MKNHTFSIERITKMNYHMFDDMVFWRIHGRERMKNEKDASKITKFEKANAELQRQGFYVYAALYEGRFVGWISLIYIPKIGKWNRGIIFVEELWTVPDYRRKGIAAKLMKKAFEVQRKTHALKVRLYTDNPEAEAFYKKCGLVKTKEAIFMESKEDGRDG